MEWIIITIFATIMQIARTALQKGLKEQLSDMAVVWTRYGFAFPFVLLYTLIWMAFGYKPTNLSTAFFVYCFVGGMAQIAATAMLIRLFSHRNFVVSTMLSKLDALIIFILGVTLLGDRLSPLGFLAVAGGSCGMLITLAGRKHAEAGDFISAFKRNDAWLGLGASALFAICAICILLAIRGQPQQHQIFAAALVLTVMIFMQAVILGIYLFIFDKGSFKDMLVVRNRVVAVSITSVLGSIGWFSAFALAHPAYVKTLAQIELPLAIIAGAMFFKEKVNSKEIYGMALISLAACVVAFVRN